jgi:hypothetical protein
MKPRVKPSLLFASLLLSFLLILAIPQGKAAATNNPIFATIYVVQQMLATALSPIQNLVQSLTSRVGNLEATVTPLPGQIANIQATLTPIPSQVADIQTHQGQDDQQIAALNQQVQALSDKINTAPTSINWDITGNYTLRFLGGFQPLTETINITTVDPTTGQFSGTGNMGDWKVTLSGDINGSQFTLRNSFNPNTPSYFIEISGSITPEGKLWGNGILLCDETNPTYPCGGTSYQMFTLSGAATKK